MEKQIITSDDVETIESVLGKPQQNPIVPSEKERAFFESYPDDSFLPSVKLLQGTSGEIAELHPSTGKPMHAIGDFFLTLKNKNLGREVPITVLTRRAHAIMFRDNRKEKESFQYESPLFQEIMHTPNNRAQNLAVNFCIGDFLLWLPSEDTFATFFPGNKTGRPVAFTIIDHMAPLDTRTEAKKDLMYTNCFVLGSKFRKFGDKNQCFVPIVTPVEPSHDLMPDPALVEPANTMFWAPVEAEARVVPNTAPSNR